MYRIRRSALLRDLELAEFLLAGVAGAVRRSAGGSSLVVGTVLVCFIVGVVERIDKGIGIDLETFHSACCIEAATGGYRDGRAGEFGESRTRLREDWELAGVVLHDGRVQP